MEQLVISPQPLALLVLAKALAHWFVAGLPLVAVAPLLAVTYHLPGPGVTALCATLLLGTPTLSAAGLDRCRPDGGCQAVRRAAGPAGSAVVSAGTDFRCPRDGAGRRRRGHHGSAVPSGRLFAFGAEPGAARHGCGDSNQPGLRRMYLPNWMHKLASPPHFYRIAGRMAPWFLWPALLLLAVAAFGGLVLAPPDYQQGDAFRIIYVHVPSAYLSMMVYVTMAWPLGRWPRLAHQARARRRGQLRPDRRLVHLCRPGHRCRVGQADVGHLLGVGSAPDVGTDPPVSLLWLHGPSRRLREPEPG